MSDIEMDAHHSISLITGARTRVCCPECGSDEYGCNLVFDRCDVEYSDGHVDEGYMEFAHSDYRCNDCGYCDD